MPSHTIEFRFADPSLWVTLLTQRCNCFETKDARQMKHEGSPAVPRADSDSLVQEILRRFDLSPGDLAKYLGTSLVSVVRWVRGDTKPDSRIQAELAEILDRLA